MKFNFFQKFTWCAGLFFKLLHVNWQITYGAWRVFGLDTPLVTIFGGSRVVKENIYFTEAMKLAARFADEGISVLTGGGPGIMEAVSCGITHEKKARGKTMGIGVRHLESKNPCVEIYFELDYFFARKWLLTHYSDAFIIFPGGFGTMDEFFEIITLIQTKQSRRVPIVLLGTEYWKPLMAWISEEAIRHGLIPPADLELFTVTDDLERAFCTVRDECKL